MKKAIQIAVFFFVTGALSVIVYSCCPGEYRIIGLDDVHVFHSDTTLRNTNDTIYGEFYFLGNATVARISQVDLRAFMNVAYALSCDYPFDNEFDPASFEWTCDQAVFLNGNMIPAGQNIPVPDAVETSASDGYGEFWLKIPQEFLDTVVFQRDWYTFNLHIETTDGQAFEMSVRLFMQL